MRLHSIRYASGMAGGRIWIGHGTVLMAGTTALAASCAIGPFAIIDPPPNTASSGGDGGEAGAVTTDGGSGGAGGGGTCQHHTWPAPPSSDDGGSDDVEFVVAFRTVTLGDDAPPNAPVGFDLDNRCTCQGEGDSCKEPDFATADHCDLPGGRDNATGQLFATASVFNPDLKSSQFSDGSEDGSWSLLVRISDYNGLPNDLQVTVAIYPSPGIRNDPCNAPDSQTTWRGDDRWPISESSLLDVSPDTDCDGTDVPIDVAKFLDVDAYVSDGTLVASLPQAGLLLPIDDGTTPLQLTAGFIAADLIEFDDGQWRLDNGILAGRWRVDDLLAVLSKVQSGGEPLCTDHDLYPLLKQAVCSYPDIASSLGGPTTPCDALSFAMAFTAEPAALGSVLADPEETSFCPPETDPANDGCGR